MPPRGLLPYKNAAIRAAARDPDKMQGFWPAAILGAPSADVESENSFLKEASQLNNYLLGTFQPSSRWSRDTVNMKSIELVAILVATSDFQNFFLGPLRAPKEPPGSGNSSVHAPSSPRSSSKQNDCIFTMDSGALCPPPTL